jgi:KaiC/GvpD/RAD55 family RecA-like ATPase
MSDGKYIRMPTGVADFDSILNGGLPAGSVVLLLGDVGAGQLEFCLTSAAKIGLVLENPKSLEFFLGHAAKHSKLPEKLSYITFSKSKQDILQEVALSFNRDYHDSLVKRLEFKDFSEKYFMRTIVPPHWVQESKPNKLFSSGESDRSLLEDFVAFFDENSNNSMIIVDSLTDLIMTESVPFSDLIAVLKGLKRMAKNWKCLIYLILTDDILDKRKQQMIIDSVDGVLRFEWSKSVHSSNRQRYMYVEKFMPVLATMEQERIMRFATLVTSQSGFVVIDTERVA